MEVKAERQDAGPADNAWPPGHSRVATGRIGVLLVNLGTPDGTDYWSMRRYLAEFLTDRRVIEWSPLFWYPILYGIILNRRPQRVGEAYRMIWNSANNESVLRTYTRNQGEALGRRLDALAPNITVDWAMRYGKPSIAKRLDALKDAGCERILLFPLYPQYSASTTATVCDKAFQALARMRWQPALRVVPPYYDDPVYIDALARSARAHLATLGLEPEVILASFHGIPQSYFEKGDPYYCHCRKTARLLRDALGLDEGRLIMTFQSRFGPERWLEPYTDETVRRLAGEGLRRIAVINPGFVSDCLETLEEIAVLAREHFLAAGGEHFAHIPCLNDSERGLDVIEHIVRRELMGWI
jgi:ferrochelatase